jgi:hypothetical protein
VALVALFVQLEQGTETGRTQSLVHRLEEVVSLKWLISVDDMAFFKLLRVLPQTRAVGLC